jgi:serine/threonine protein kinase
MCGCVDIPGFSTFLPAILIFFTYSQLRVLHRDIAARNILVSDSNIVKLGDFGQARVLADDADDWKLDKAGRLPVRYMPPESLITKRFSFKSDVWAFGVTMWEMMAYVRIDVIMASLDWVCRFGAFPYKSDGIPNEEVRDFILSGKRLNMPKVGI